MEGTAIAEVNVRANVLRPIYNLAQAQKEAGDNKSPDGRGGERKRSKEVYEAGYAKKQGGKAKMT